MAQGDVKTLVKPYLIYWTQTASILLLSVRIYPHSFKAFTGDPFQHPSHPFPGLAPVEIATSEIRWLVFISVYRSRN